MWKQWEQKGRDDLKIVKTVDAVEEPTGLVIGESH